MKLQDFDFRIWNNETERHETNKCLISLLMIDVLTRVAHLNGNKFEIELWTGYFDKNGNKIYENDIIKNESLEEIYYITRDNTYKMFKLIIYDKDLSLIHNLRCPRYVVLRFSIGRVLEKHKSDRL
ncbi:YopX family protein [Campylobacter jejuni]